MSTPHYLPAGMHTVTPHLVCAGAVEALEFYKKAFDAVETIRLPGPDGKLIHAMLIIAGSPVMFTDEMPHCGAISPKTLKGSPVTIHLYVPDTDAFYARAVAAGATAVMPPADMFWGDRYGVLTDPWGHSWSIATHQQDLTPAEIEANFKKACG
ncbi:MAG: VOC family protein [Burkholderiales bacterium]|nr:VOC family protein [Burkholderiales bacterium]